MNHYNFKTMASWDMTKLKEVRKKLRDELADEIHKRDAIKAEIVFLQKEIYNFQSEA